MDIVVIGAFFAVFISIALLVVYLQNLYEQKRTKALADVAQEFAFDFSPQGDSGYFDSLRSLHLFSQGENRRWTNQMRGESGGLAVSIFDYQFTTGSGKNKNTLKQTVICFQFDVPTLPLFSLRPESFWHKVGGWFGMKDIDFDSHPQFSSAYYLQGPDEAAIREAFQPKVLAFFEQNPNLSVEAVGNRLIFYTPKIRLNPNEVRGFLARGFEILNLFRG